MSVVTLRGNAHLALPQYSFATLLTGATGISYHVESEHPTVVFAVPEAGLAAFRASQNYTYWGTTNAANIRATNHDYKGPSIKETWYLVIVNYNQNPTAVYYRVPA